MDEENKKFVQHFCFESSRKDESFDRLSAFYRNNRICEALVTQFIDYAAGRTTVVRFLAGTGKRIFSLRYRIQTGSWGPHSLLSDEYRVSFPGSKAAEV